jgi:hypothetical protein
LRAGVDQAPVDNFMVEETAQKINIKCNNEKEPG